MRLLILSEYYPPYIKGGSEVSTSILAGFLAKHHLVSVICGPVRDTPWMQERVKVFPDLRFASVGTKSVISAVKYAVGIVTLPIINLFKLVNKIRFVRPDIVQVVPSSYQFIPMIIFTRLILSKSVVVDCRDYSLVCPTNLSSEDFDDTKNRHHGVKCLAGYSTGNTFLNLLSIPFALYESAVFNLNKSLFRFVINRFDQIVLVANSDYVRNQLILNGYSTEKIVSIPNPMIINSKKSATVRQRNTNVFVYAGRIEKSKGLWSLIKAVEILNQKKAKVLLKIAGNGNLKRSVEKYVFDHRINNIKFLGQVTPAEVSDLYNTAWGIVAPSAWPEPFGRFILESISTTTPCVATDTGGTRQGISNRLTGLLVAPNNPVHLSKAMETLLKDHELYETLQKNLLKEKAKYTVSTIAKRRMDLYTSLLLKP